MTKTRPIKKILVANRGEIACRIFRTAGEMGMETVAVYSDGDRDAQHRKLADQAFRIGPAPVAASYLDGSKILKIAKSCGADAIHPGYGFLAENAEFAEACAREGVIFVGPSPESIRAMGLKDQAKALMEKAGVPVVPGYHGKEQSPRVLAEEAKKIGYPVLIKAVAGGGGKGMRLVEGKTEFRAALEGAQREAEKAFGNPAVLIEKYLAHSRHIEIQVFGDQSGKVVHLFERDCSLQRRHQKVVEEAPAPGMTAGLRLKMCTAAVKAAQSIAYIGAGTIEFIVDASEPLSDDSAFYFMEMNTRLQVEHPVTEYLTGQDLVALQLEIAMGNPIPFDQIKTPPERHAVEVRLYAEDPEKDFLPQTGDLHFFRFPTSSDDLRIDSGFVEGDTISPYYDPMIAKIIAGGRNRDDAIKGLRRALEESTVAGCKTNLEFLAAIAGHEAFAAGVVDTSFLERHHQSLRANAAAPGPEDFALAALVVHATRGNRRQCLGWPGADQHSPWASANGWRLNLSYKEGLELVLDGQTTSLTLKPLNEGLLVEFEDHSLVITGSLGPEGHLEANIDGRALEALGAVFGGQVTLARGSSNLIFTLASRIDDEDVATEGPGAVKAPMPGRILKLFVKAGQEVTLDQPLLIMEAMKMEYTLTSPRGGVVGEVMARKGDQVAQGGLILEVHDETGNE